MPELVATTSAEDECNEACMAASHVHMALNHIEEVEDESKEDKPVDIYMDKMSSVDMRITFKDTTNARYTRDILHF
jgi:hypothetical protein